MPIWVYGNLNYPDANYKKRHATTYLEYEIPKRLEKKLEKYIDKEIAKFDKKCKCAACKSERKNKK